MKFSYLLILSNKIEAINDSKLIETTSPMEAAKGVAKLSGFKRYFWDNNITATNTKSENGKFLNFNKIF